MGLWGLLVTVTAETRFGHQRRSTGFFMERYRRRQNVVYSKTVSRARPPALPDDELQRFVDVLRRRAATMGIGSLTATQRRLLASHASPA
jgi:hypothetical protein